MNKLVKESFNNETLSKVCKLYEIQLIDLKLIRSNSNFVYDCGDKILRFTNSKTRDENDIKLELAWIEYLRNNKIEVVKIIDSIHGKKYEILGSSPEMIVVCFEKINGEKVSEQKWTSQHFSKLGELLGSLHKLSLNYNSELLYKNWNEIIEHKIFDYLPIDSRELNKLYRLIIEEIEGFPVTKYNYGVIHNDIHHGNYLLCGSDIVLFDFEVTCTSWFISDISTVLYYASQTKYASNNPGFESYFMKYFWQGYELNHQIDKNEKHYISTFLLYRDLLVYGYLHKVWNIDNLNKQKDNYFKKIEKSINSRRIKLKL